MRVRMTAILCVMGTVTSNENVFDRGMMKRAE